MRRAITAWRSARSASLFVGGRFGSETKAMTAPQSLRISPARSRTFVSISCRLHWQFHLMRLVSRLRASASAPWWTCLLYTSDAADEEDSVDLGGRRII